MSRKPTEVVLSEEQREALSSLVRASTTEQRLVKRARIVLLAAQGESTSSIARKEGVRLATVSKWRGRFAALGLEGLKDTSRPGAPPRYDMDTRKRLFAKLDEDPPSGYATWNGRLLAEALGDVSKHQVWRVLREHRIQLQRRRSWCISTDPEFAQKAADIVGVYLEPPTDAIVISVDEKPHIQALERAQGYLKFPNGRSLTGFSHEYKRHGTTTLFAALNVLTGRVDIRHHTNRRRRIEFLAFMNDVVALYPDQQLHVILDNLSTHKPKKDLWLARHPNVHFYYTPTHASWLNQVECWFSILSRQALRPASFTSAKQVREAIDKFIAAYNSEATPFVWTKRQVHSVHPKKKYADLCK